MMPMRWTFPVAFCARAQCGQAVAVPAIPFMKSRRRIASPEAYEHRFQSSTLPGVWREFQAQVSEWQPMSALGQKQTLGKVRLMSALPPKATLIERVRMSALCQKRTHAVQQFAIYWSKY